MSNNKIYELRKFVIPLSMIQKCKEITASSQPFLLISLEDEGRWEEGVRISPVRHSASEGSI